MTTAYNLRNKMGRSSEAERGSRLDPGSGGIIILNNVDRAVVVLEVVGARTLEDAAVQGLGTEILVISQTDAITCNGITIDDGEAAKFVVILDTSGDHIWENGADLL